MLSVFCLSYGAGFSCPSGSPWCLEQFHRGILLQRKSLPSILLPASMFRHTNNYHVRFAAKEFHVIPNSSPRIRSASSGGARRSTLHTYPHHPSPPPDFGCLIKDGRMALVG